MKSDFARSTMMLAAVGCACCLLTTPATGAGFQLNESSASGLGNAFAGGAAAAQDASTVWTNPAGMSLISGNQVVGVIHFITPSIRFKDDGSTAATTGNQPLGGDGGNAGGTNVVPGFYLVMPIEGKLTAGLGISAPWGLVTDYDGDWAGRFHGTKSSIRTINLNPAIAWKAADGLSLGVGLNYQRISAEFNSRMNYSAALLGAGIRKGLPAATLNALALATPLLEAGVSVKGDDNAFGWNAGLLWDLDANSRIGFHYRSRIKYQITGNSSITAPAIPAAFDALTTGLSAAYNTAVTSDVTLPAIANISYFRTLNSQWDLMADAQWTEWSTIPTLSIVSSNGSTLQSTPENFKNTWKLAFGVNYRPGGSWMWRGGLAFDMTPVRDEYRTVRVPDASRTWLSVGAQYAVDSRLRLDVGAAYLWSRTGTIDFSGDAATGGSATYGRLLGHYDNHTVIVSGQVVFSF